MFQALQEGISDNFKFLGFLHLCNEVLIKILQTYTSLRKEGIWLTSPSRNEVELCKAAQKTEYYFMNISDAQLYRLKQKFDIDTIKEIDEKCTREQIINIVGKIINGIPFELDEYFSPEKFTPPTLVDEDFKPILVEPEDMPFQNKFIVKIFDFYVYPFLQYCKSWKGVGAV